MDSPTRVLIRKWAIVLASGLFVFLLPVPDGITRESWALLAIFIATIVGTILRPVPSGAMVLLGITAVILARVMPVYSLRIGTGSIETARIKSALAGYADPVVWLVLAAFFISRGMIKTGLGRRIAYLFIRTIGHRSLGLGYALVGTDMVMPRSYHRMEHARVGSSFRSQRALLKPMSRSPDLRRQVLAPSLWPFITSAR